MRALPTAALQALLALAVALTLGAGPTRAASHEFTLLSFNIHLGGVGPRGGDTVR